MSLFRITLDTNPEDCNLKCLMCEEHSPYSDFIQQLYSETGTKRRRMPFEWISRLIQEAAILGAKEIIPSTMGEPLLYKGIENLFTTATKFGVLVNLTTNGTFPKKSLEEWADIIIPASSDVKISWNGATKEVSEKIMNKIKFEKSLENVRRFVEIRNRFKKEGKHVCTISFQLTFLTLNMHELPDIVQMAIDLGIDRVKGHHLWAHFPEIKDLAIKSSDIHIKQWNENVEKAILISNKYTKADGSKIVLDKITPLSPNSYLSVPDNFECPFLGKEIWISATGKISPCCAPDALRQSLGSFGNIENTTIQKVLSSKEYQDLLTHYKSYDVCKTCNMRKPIK